MRIALSRRGDYAIRAMLALAEHEAPGADGLLSVRIIAERTRIPAGFAAHVLADLVRSGLVRGSAGRAGGYRLSSPADSISLLRVVEAAEGRVIATRCVLRGSPCDPAGHCVVHDVIARTTSAAAAELACTSLGGAFAARLKQDGEDGAARLMLHAGGTSMLLALVFAKLGSVARDAGVIAPEGLVSTLASLSCKRPPGPVYLLFHGGAGLLLLAAMMTVDRLGRLDAWLRFTTRMGRTSFFLFVVQFFVFNEFFFRARLPMSPVWPLYFAATVALVGLASWWWDAGGYNRFMTMRILRGQTAPDERSRTA